MLREKEDVIPNILLKKKAASGMIILGTQTIVSIVIYYLTNIVLYRLLTPQLFGTWAVVNFITLTLGLLTNFGLCQALIQKKVLYTTKELQGVFTVFFCTGILSSILFYFFAPHLLLLVHVNLSGSDTFWLRMFAVCLLFLNPQTISHSLLERKLDYKKIAIGDTLSLLVVQLLIVIFAVMNYGIGSFILGTLFGRAINFALFYYLAPWKIGFNFKFGDLKQLLPFGVNYQMNSIISTVNGAVIPIFIGAVAGPYAVGILNWASGIQGIVLMPFSFMKLLVFPVCSRLQDAKEDLKKYVEKIISFSALLSFPLIAAVFALAPSVIAIIYTSKWIGGITAVYLFLVQGIFSGVSWMLIDVLFALGAAKKVRNISLFWTGLQWILTSPLVLLWNYNGVVLAGIIVSLTFFIPLNEVRKHVDISIGKPLLKYLTYSFFMGLFLFYLSHMFIIHSIWNLLLECLLGFVIYIVLLFLFERGTLWHDFLSFKKLLFE